MADVRCIIVDHLIHMHKESFVNMNKCLSSENDDDSRKFYHYQKIHNSINVALVDIAKSESSLK